MPQDVRGRPRAFDRDLALDRAIRLFWRKGYEATSIRELSHEMGIGQPSLYNAFGGKRALFAEAVATYDVAYGGFIDAAIAEEPTAYASIRRILTEAPSRYTRTGLPRGCLVTSGDGGTDDASVHELLLQVRRDKTDRLRRKIEKDLASGELAQPIDASSLAGFVMGVLAGLVQAARDGASTQELEAIARLAVNVIPEQSASSF